MKNNRVKDRIRKCRMIEKMELQRNYSEKIGLKNVSTFQKTEREKESAIAVQLIHTDRRVSL